MFASKQYEKPTLFRSSNHVVAFSLQKLASALLRFPGNFQSRGTLPPPSVQLLHPYFLISRVFRKMIFKTGISAEDISIRVSRLYGKFPQVIASPLINAVHAWLCV